MGISMNPKTSGFRKWAEIHQPEKIDKSSTGANEGAIAVPDRDQVAKTPDQQAHRPWLVPGEGRL